jgi:hypothetical protein
MGIYYTGDPVRDYDRYYEDQEKEMEKYPECAVCGKRITDDFLYYIEEDIYCEECMKDNFRRPTDDFIKEN